ncbi:hypothetical protein GKC30_13975 [Pseudodesulfovibrio sp. F-1]|uniref:Type IV pilus assembly PilZ n=1 Tax=Pseudodesulfovibrio alkaliphilus TaxID=2661613 RepID=A0A7K1KRM9_9BACT|nr:hypothetical protein [Pseudodesulfovibrio alkaliphilus]MUM78745.1 hypothetical protein [Pseudodesulfovibrio alkaliphilus]
MLDLHAQLDYLRDVQRTFGSGSSRLDMLEVFSTILTFVAPVVMVMAFWYYRRTLGFAILRFFSRLLAGRSQTIVENYLVSKGVMLDIYLYSGGVVGRLLCNARISAVMGGRMQLELVSTRPTTLKLKNTRVVCFCKPFAYSGRKINSFITLIGHARKRGSVIKDMTLLTPIRYRFIIRRRHDRKKIAIEGAVRVKAWDVRKRKSFWLVKPDLQTVNNPAHYGDKMRLSVENISAGGIRLLIINPKGQLPPIAVGNQLVLRVSVWNPQTRKFTYFLVIGTIRSRFKGGGGSLGMGIQFTAEGEQGGGGFMWKSVQGEIASLAEFLERVQ